MKTKLFTLIAMGAATAIGHAFTIDFNALDVPFGTTVTSSTPLTVNVAGYGQVTFEVTNPDALVVSNSHQNGSGTIKNSLELGTGETVVVTFIGPEALNVNFDIIGINDGDSANVTPIGFTGQIHQVDSSGGNGVGIAAVSWNTIPEPSSSLLVLVGAGSLILRRRRG